jgi:hypothetical protein
MVILGFVTSALLNSSSCRALTRHSDKAAPHRAAIRIGLIPDK